MSTPKPSKYLSQELPFKLESLVATDTPDGSEGDWYCYVISQGANQITGLRSGTKSAVQSEVHDMVDRLNERREGKTRPKLRAVQSAPKAAAPTP
jgi:hypothetical protein